MQVGTPHYIDLREVITMAFQKAAELEAFAGDQSVFWLFCASCQFT